MERMNGWAVGGKLGNGVVLGDGVIYIGLGSLVLFVFLGGRRTEYTEL